MERRDTSRFKTFSRRSVLLGGSQVALLSALVGRLYYLQVVESDQYAVLADDNRISLRLLAPRRGRILDRYGVELASNRQNYRVVLVPEQAGNVQRTLAKLAELVPLDDYQRQRILREVERRRKFVPVTISDNLSWDDFARVNLQSPYLPGVQLDVGETRDYPYGETLAHVVGYVSAVSEQDVDDSDDPLLALPGFRVGKSGLEKVYEDQVRGKAGDSRVEVNAVGRVIRELARQEGEPGNDLVLTIDAELQKFTADRLNRELAVEQAAREKAHEKLVGELPAESSAAAVVLDVLTGEVFAMVSVPAFDPNAFNVGVTAEYWKKLNGNSLHPLNNKVISGTYAPGSTFKLMVATAGLASGAITADHHVGCAGQMTLGNATFHCWKKGGHGSIGLLKAIQQSCDVFFYDVARRTGIDAIAAIANQFGLGKPTGIDLPNERGGLIPTQAWKKATYHESWAPGDTVVAGIGQGYVAATPMQLAVMAARIANGGHSVTPRLVRESGTMREGAASIAATVDGLPKLDVPPQVVQLVQNGMYMVVNEQGGTGGAARIKDPGFIVAGKTGTAQAKHIAKHERDKGELKWNTVPWEERDNGLFVCFAPVGNPRYACCVVIEHAGTSGFAAGAAHDIMLKVQQLDPARRVNRDQVAGTQSPNGGS
jgi:penicillin-binding protein 2